jgi:CheY-like chemotaxis protein
MSDDPQQPAVRGEQTNVKTILIVEDDANIGEVFVQAISQETPHLAILATNGAEALNVIKNVKPSLFILDYRLPHMNGIELYDQLHTTPGLEHVQAIMMSAQLPRRELEKRHIVGMHKPIDLDEFLQTIEQLLT